MIIDSKEKSYFLGFMWSDGYIRHYVAKNKVYNHKISLEINKDDAEAIKPILDNVLKFSIHKRKRKKNWKETWTFSKNSKILYDFLESNDYRDKSKVEPSKILTLIPEQFKIYFWKGVLDGDGSMGLAGRGAYLELASTYDYKYIEFGNWINSFGISGNIYRQISKKNHKSSVYKIYGKKIIPIGKALPEYGLLRKNDKLKQILNKYEK